jgi:hypothetical protein
MELAVYLFGVMSGVFVTVAAMHAFQLRRGDRPGADTGEDPDDYERHLGDRGANATEMSAPRDCGERGQVLVEPGSVGGFGPR